MLIRSFWRNCDYRGKSWGAAPIDAFWVEATQEEAEVEVFPRLQSQTINESKELAERYKRIAEEVRNPPRSFCFLVARDLSTIDPFHVHYPFHQLWNAYSPFESMPEIVIANLDELRNLDLP